MVTRLQNGAAGDRFEADVLVVSPAGVEFLQATNLPSGTSIIVSLLRKDGRRLNVTGVVVQNADAGKGRWRTKAMFVRLTDAPDASRDATRDHCPPDVAVPHPHPSLGSFFGLSSVERPGGDDEVLRIRAALFS